MVLACLPLIHAAMSASPGFHAAPIYRATPLIVPSIANPGSVASLAVRPGLPKPAKSIPVKPAMPNFGTNNLRLPAVDPLVAFVETARAAAAPIIDVPKKGLEDTICDVMASGSDIAGVLTMLSVTTKANIVCVSKSDQPINMSLRRVKLGEALKLVSSVAGMTYIKVGGAFIVGTEEKLKGTYPKEWEKAFPTPPVKMGGHDGASDPPAASKEPVDPFVSAIHTLDYAVPGQMVESLKLLYEGKGLSAVVGPASTSPALADKDSASSTGVTAGVLANDNKPAGRTIILRGPKSIVDEAIATMVGLDKQRKQVHIDVTIYDITDAALNELGVSWDFGTSGITEAGNKGVNLGSFARTPFNFTNTIKALETVDKAKILASPSVSVLDAERAFVLIGNRLNLPKLDGYDASGRAIYSTTEYRVGIYLQVAPAVAADGSITLAIYPQVSTIAGSTVINGASYPNIATREAQSTLRVHSGETIVLGGLLKNDEIDQMERVPILSKIPILGELFTRRKKSKGSSQVVISLTPTIMKGE